MSPRSSVSAFSGVRAGRTFLEKAPLRAAASTVAIAALCAGCLPLVVPTTDRPPAVTDALPAEFTTGERDILVLVVSRNVNAIRIMGDPLFVKPAELPELAAKLESTSLTGVVFLGGITPHPIDPSRVSEICAIAATGRTVSLHRERDKWRRSHVILMSADWRDQFLAYLSKSRSALTIQPQLRRAPCDQADWSAGISVRWSGEQRAKASAFLREVNLVEAVRRDVWRVTISLGDDMEWQLAGNPGFDSERLLAAVRRELDANGLLAKASDPSSSTVEIVVTGVRLRSDRAATFSFFSGYDRITADLVARDPAGKTPHGSGAKRVDVVAYSGGPVHERMERLSVSFADHVIQRLPNAIAY